MLPYLGYFAAPFTIAIIATPLIKKLALKWSVVAHENHRTVHTGQIPKLGGLAILLALLGGMALLAWTHPQLVRGLRPQLLALAIGAIVLSVMGGLDDKFNLNCNLKLIIEIFVALLAAKAGWRVESMILPGAYEFSFGALSYPISILWIVGIANALNMIDGLDGLASGVVIVVAFMAAAIAALFGHTLLIFLSIVVAGAVAGFLRYNINPAQIFMGDSGSISLGFIVACIAMTAPAVAPHQIAGLVPILLLGIPLADTLLAIIRRVRRGIHPFHADREHIHHRLVGLGLTHPGAAMFIIGVSFILGVLAFLAAQGIHTDLRLLSLK